MAPKLHYFQGYGLAEAIRYILHYGGHKFEDILYAKQDWPIKSVKDALPYGQLPLYEEGDRSLHQSLAIARYLASKTNLLPLDPWHQAILDATVYTIYDFWTFVVAYIKETDATKKLELKKKLLTETIDFYFSRFEKELKANGGYFSGKLSWADFVFLGILETANYFLEEQIEKKYPTIVSLMNKLRTLPGVKEYIASRKF